MSKKLWWTFLHIVFVTAASECDIACKNLPNIPPQWKYNGTVVPISALMCVINSSCHLNVGELARNDNQMFRSIDLYLECNGGKLGKELLLFFQSSFRKSTFY